MLGNVLVTGLVVCNVVKVESALVVIFDDGVDVIACDVECG